MGSGFSFPCTKPTIKEDDLIFNASSLEPLDETLGHSFCYVRSSTRSSFLSPSHSDRFLLLSPSHEQTAFKTTRVVSETAFKTISGASVSANSYTPRTVIEHDGIYDDATDQCSSSFVVNGGFESTASFSALPLQTIPRRGGVGMGMDHGFFMSGPMERGALSGPFDWSSNNDGQIHFSAPLNGMYNVKKKRRKALGLGMGLPRIRKAFHVVPVLNFSNRKDGAAGNGGGGHSELKNENNVQWAHGKAGEDRVHVVVSEEQGWLFVGIYDGFNGPDAPEFLMGNLYRVVFNELEGLFWDFEDRDGVVVQDNVGLESGGEDSNAGNNVGLESCGDFNTGNNVGLESCGGDSSIGNNVGCCGGDSNTRNVKRVTFQQEETRIRRGKPLWEFLAEDDNDENGLDLSGSERFAFSVDDALRVSKSGSFAKRGSLLLSKLKSGIAKHKEGQGLSRRFFPWRYDWDGREKPEVENRVGGKSSCRKRRVGPVDHELVLRAISRALEVTELAYLKMTENVLDRYPELALMGSCLLVVLMRDEDVYVMNLGDSRAIVAQYELANNGLNMNHIVEESGAVCEGANHIVTESSAQTTRLTALQLSTDHSTSIEEEVLRIKQEHPDDNQCIVNDRVKGRLKVTRAFGAGFLKQPKLNNALLEMFRNEYIGTTPYLSCSPSLCYHKLCANDQFLILSSDGLYQYLTNEEVVSHVESFMDKFPEGDPAQHLIEELLFRAAKKAGMVNFLWTITSIVLFLWFSVLCLVCRAKFPFVQQINIPY
ncbi:hypothetical protein GIB67_013564 [Kingdonia uniflora]|uniref:PPM-type phosphatase domain-containing protein n=1 Tax=Kingdonia uniflora TaxID=39325 RepID=A0A7J7KV09_9MAGN|nr:hypothetical protein GIB67_013564 [Kingdonia uniflora]